MFIELGNDWYEDRAEVTDALNKMERKSPRLRALVETINDINNSPTLVMYHRKNIDELIKKAKESQSALESLGATGLLDSLMKAKEQKDYHDWKKVYDVFVYKLNKIGLTDSDPLNLLFANPYSLIGKLYEENALGEDDAKIVEKCIQSIQEYKIDKDTFPLIGKRLPSGDVILPAYNLDGLKITFIESLIPNQWLKDVFFKFQEMKEIGDKLNDYEEEFDSISETKETVLSVFMKSSPLLDIETREHVHSQIAEEQKQINEFLEETKSLYNSLHSKKKEIEFYLNSTDLFSYSDCEKAWNDSTTLDEFKLNLVKGDINWKFADWLIENNYTVKLGE